METIRAFLDGKAEFKSLMGRDYLVVPVTALIEGVYKLDNATEPELVTRDTLAQLPAAWNGRPVIADHPVVNGECTSANDPSELDNRFLGYIFNARVEDGALKMDAWINMETPAAGYAPTNAVLTALQNRENIEVSIGAFVHTNPKEGSFEGRKYKAVWETVIPDHLAFLSQGEGVCSLEKGCGVRFFSKDYEHGVEWPEKDTDAAELLRDFEPRSFISGSWFDRDIRQLLQAALDESYLDSFGYPDAYVIAFSSDTVVFEYFGAGRFSIMSMGYEMNGQQVRWTSEPVHVFLAVMPVPLNGQSVTNINTMSKDTTQEAAAEEKATDNPANNNDDGQDGGSSAAPAGDGLRAAHQNGQGGGEPAPLPENVLGLAEQHAHNHLGRELQDLIALRDKHREGLVARIVEAGGDGEKMKTYSVQALQDFVEVLEAQAAKGGEADDGGAGDGGDDGSKPKNPQFYGAAGNAAAPKGNTAPPPPNVWDN